MALDSELNARALASPDPIALHFLYGIIPLQLIQVLQQSVRIGGDLQHPLLHGDPDHRVIPALALPVDDLLIGEHGAECLAPVHGHLRLVRQPALQQLQENPLRPLVVLWIRGGNLPIPVVAEPQALQLLAEPVHILLRSDSRVRPRLQRILLRGQAERVPAHGVQNVKALHALVAGDDVGRGIALWVTDVQARSARVREHVQYVVLRLRCVHALRGAESFVVGPVLLPLGLQVRKGERRRLLRRLIVYNRRVHAGLARGAADEGVVLQWAE
mmetsp:Transcript_36599/g.65494  ORF Transcript_36599/g.65494 Transcript_36599/m.65494 type:complete len:272 (+) Transcript_36599:2151-2966(+)